MKFLLLDGAVFANDLLENFVGHEFSLNGAIFFVFSQPTLARKRVRLGALRCSENIVDFRNT